MEDMKGITYEPIHEETVYIKVLSIVLIAVQENLWGEVKSMSRLPLGIL